MRFPCNIVIYHRFDIFIVKLSDTVCLQNVIIAHAIDELTHDKPLMQIVQTVVKQNVQIQ